MKSFIYNKMVDNVKETYKKMGLFTIGPIYFSIEAIREARKAPSGGMYNSDAGAALLGIAGWLSLPITIPLTCITAPLGIVGLVGTTAASALALPTAKIVDLLNNTESIENVATDIDNNSKEKSNNSKLPTSTADMFQTMNVDSVNDNIIVFNKSLEPETEKEISEESQLQKHLATDYNNFNNNEEGYHYNDKTGMSLK